MELKEILLRECEQFVNNRLQNIQKTILSNQKALASETKSSAGDKHETGRAMLQLEMEKAGKQLANIQHMKTTLAKINVSQMSKVGCLGSVIETNIANYFLAISAGKINACNKDYFAVSVSSPIGKLLLGKKEKEAFLFNNATIKIQKID